MEYQKIVDSYKESFKSPIGAYVYMFLNQRFPEMFVISSSIEKDISLVSTLENILQNETNLKSIIEKIKEISPQLVENSSSVENEITIKTLEKSLGNLSYLNIDWESPQAWDSLNGIIDYNNYGIFIKNKKELTENLQSICKKYSLKALELNPNYKPEEFLSDFTTGLDVMCKALNIRPNQIGLNTLSVGYQNEEGNFTGYATSDGNDDNVANIINIKKNNVFAHEWLHFIDSSFGLIGHSISSLLDTFSEKDFLKFRENFKSFADFKSILYSTENSYSEVPINEAIKDASHFLTRYAKDSSTFRSDLDNIVNDFSKNVAVNNIDSISILKGSIENLLDSNYPPRYFSFIEAQCQLYIDDKNKVKLEENQLVDFSKKADKILGEKNYTESTIEMLARTFESFLLDKVKSNNEVCPILAQSYNSDMYQQGKLKEKIDANWEKMWLEMKAGIDEVMPEVKEVVPNLNMYVVRNNIQNMRKNIERQSLNTNKIS